MARFSKNQLDEGTIALATSRGRIPTSWKIRLHNSLNAKRDLSYIMTWRGHTGSCRSWEIPLRRGGGLAALGSSAFFSSLGLEFAASDEAWLNISGFVKRQQRRFACSYNETRRTSCTASGFEND